MVVNRPRPVRGGSAAPVVAPPATAAGTAFADSLVTLHQYHVADWAGEVVRQLRAAPSEAPVRLLYLDGFAAPGAVVPRVGGGAARLHIAAVSALDAAVRAAERYRRAAEGVAVFVEEDPAKVQWLLTELRAAGLAERLRVNPAPAELRTGNVAVVQAAFAAVAEPFTAWAAGATRALVRLTPAGAAQLPLAAVLDAAHRGTAELLIQLPVQGSGQPALHGGGALADLAPRARRTVYAFAAMFGVAPHAWLSWWRSAGSTTARCGAEAHLLDRYRAVLMQALPNLVAKPLVLRSSGGGEEAYSLLLTPDAVRALAFNRTLFRARAEGGLECTRPDAPGCEAGFVREERSGPLNLFGPGAGEPETGTGGRPLGRAVNAPAVAQLLATRFGGRSATWAELAAALTASDLFPEELKRVLAQMKRERRVAYENLAAAAAVVQFADGARLPPAPLSPAPPSAAPLFLRDDGPP